MAVQGTVPQEQRLLQAVYAQVHEPDGLSAVCHMTYGADPGAQLRLYRQEGAWSNALTACDFLLRSARCWCEAFLAHMGATSWQRCVPHGCHLSYAVVGRDHAAAADGGGPGQGELSAQLTEALRQLGCYHTMHACSVAQHPEQLTGVLLYMP